MGVWSRFFRWRARAGSPDGPPDEQRPTGGPPESAKTVALPTEPFVFECQSCGKVFEARRLRPLCPECDSRDVSLVSDE